jgi:hypothetical protein
MQVFGREMRTDQQDASGQPVRQARVGRQPAHQALEEMMMTVDEARHRDLPAPVDHLGLLGNLRARRPDADEPAAVYQDVAGREAFLRRVHRQDRAAANQDSCHGNSRPARRSTPPSAEIGTIARVREAAQGSGLELAGGSVAGRRRGQDREGERF